jgi:hypothetical protein
VKNADAGYIRVHERNSFFQAVIVLADGTIAATVENGDFGTSPFWEQHSGALNRACIHKGALFSQIARCVSVGMSAFWDLADIPATPAFVCYWSNSGHWPKRALSGSVANDPTATLAVRCGNGFDAGFSPYQRASLSR